MENIKDLTRLSLEYPSEEAYHEDPTISYSNLSHYERGGFSAVATLRDKKESPSLLFGSLVDTLLTDGLEEYNNRFLVAEFPKISDNLTAIVNNLFAEFGTTHNNLTDIPDIEVSMRAKALDFWAGDKWDKIRAKKVKEEAGCHNYYHLLFLAKGKTVITTELNQLAHQAVDILRNSNATKYYFAPNNPFEDIVRYYQLKFKAILHGVEYKCMFDEIIVDYDSKTIQPIDLKTSCTVGGEWDFPEHFIKWNYQIQCRLYARILQDIISKDEFFKDFTILPYKDIIIFKNNMQPLVWDVPFTFEKGTIYVGKNKQIELRDPEDIGKELDYYLKNNPSRPIGIKDENNILDWINKI